MKKYILLIAFLVVTSLVQAIGSIATFSSVQDWYPSLNKVSWNPPAWVFAPVWTILYMMIAVSGWRVWIKLDKNQIHHASMRWYGLQLFVNLLWSIFFFGLQNPLAGLVDITILLITIVITIQHFLKIDKHAAILLLPYFLWVAYASTLNIGIVYKFYALY